MYLAFTHDTEYKANTTDDLYYKSNMSDHVLLNLLNELRKRDNTMSLSLFATSLIFNNTGARMLDSIYHMALRLI